MLSSNIPTMAFGWNTYLKPAARKLANFIFANFWQSAMAFFLFVFLTFMMFFNNAFMMFFNYVKFPNSIDFSAAAIASIFETAIAIVPFFAITALFFCLFRLQSGQKSKERYYRMRFIRIYYLFNFLSGVCFGNDAAS